MQEIPISSLVAIFGFIIGIVFGGIAQSTNFCTMGAISDIVLMGNWNRFRSWMLAIAIAILFTQSFHNAELIDLRNSIYLTPNLGWLGAIIGGSLFGFGMTISGGCGNKTLVRLGAGNLKSLVVFVTMGIFAYMTVRGLTGPLRLQMENLTNLDLTQLNISTQGIPNFVSDIIGINLQSARMISMTMITGGILIFCFKDSNFRKSKESIIGGLVIGILIALSWIVTGIIGYDDFEPTSLASLTFVNPVGESIQYLMTFTGATINFGIASVGGVVVGSFIMSKLRHEFEIESFTNPSDMVLHLIGAALMGVGGILALGCTVGQGITGMSTLALSSILTLISIISGCLFGIKYLEEGNILAAIRSIY